MIRMVGKTSTREKPEQTRIKEIEAVAVNDELLRMRDVAIIMSCSLAQSYRLANDGLIPALRVRGMLRVPRAQLMAWIAKNSSGGII
jgi:excisionase family DNA binding protein